MKFERSRILPVLAGLLLVLAGGMVRAAQPDPGPDLLTDDSWYAVYLQGSHVGWMHETRETREEPKGDASLSVVVSRARMHLEVRRYGTAMTIESSMEFVEEAKTARPLRVTTEQSMGATLATRSEGVFEGDTLHLTIRAGGNVTETDVDWPKTGVGEYGADRKLLRDTGLEPGRSTTFHVWAGDLNTVIEQTTTVESVRPDGLVVLSVQQKELPGQDIRMVMQSEDWKLEKLEISSMQMEIMSTTEKKARDLSESSEDIGFATMVQVDREVPHSRLVDRAVLLVRAPEGALEHLALEDGERQKILESAPGEARVQIRRVGFPGGEPEAGSVPGDEYLESSSYLQVESRELKSAFAQAREACSEDERAALARCLTGWVQGAVQDKSLDVGFATAAEVARERRGDCTEHAVFLAALLRAAGIPSRVRAGLLYLPGSHGRSPMFGFHMWTQAWVGGWVDLDATLGGFEADALHLGLATSALADPAGMAPLAAMSPVMGRMEIEILEYESGP